jgi:hypothetical protein
VADSKEKVTIVIDVAGVPEAVRELEKLNQKLSGSKGGTAPGTAPKGGLGGSTVAASSKMAGLASSSSALGTVLGTVNPQVGAFAQIIGTAGASVGGLTTAIGTTAAIGGAGLLVALGLMAVASRNAARAQEELSRATQQATRDIREQKRAMDARDTAAGATALVEEATAGIQVLGRRREVLRAQAREEAQAALRELPSAARAALTEEQIATGFAPDFQTPELREIEAEIQRLRTQQDVQGRRAAELRRGAPSGESSLKRILGEGGAAGSGAARGARGGGATPQDTRTAAERRADVALTSSLMGETDPVFRGKDVFGKRDSETLSALGGSILDAQREAAEEQKRIEQEAGFDRLEIVLRNAEEREAIEKQSADKMREVWMGATGMMFATSVQQLADLAKGHEFQAGAFIESIGDQLVASGTQHVLQAAAYSFIPGLNFAAPGLAAAGAAEIAGGIAMGAAGARGAGGSMSGGGNAGGLGSARTGGPASPSFLDRGAQGGYSGPSTVIVNMSSTVSPNEQDARRVAEALRAGKHKLGNSYLQGTGVKTA